MDPAIAPGMLPASSSFNDGLGERRRTIDATGDAIELLCLRRELTSIPSFEFALRERASRLATFRHTYYGRVRSIDRLTDPASTLAVVSDFTRGVRLSQLLNATDQRPTIDINAALHLIRQLVSAVAMLHESAYDVAHGAIGPERVIVTSSARIVIVEYVLGAALEQLHYSRERYWQELRVALPPSDDAPRFDQRADVTQIGVVALSLVLGRVLTAEEYPDGVGEVLASAWAISSRGGLEPLPAAIRSWIARALQLDPRHCFDTALEARDELDKVLSGEDEEDLVAQAHAAAPEPYVPRPEPSVVLPPLVKPAAPAPASHMIFTPPPPAPSAPPAPAYTAPIYTPPSAPAAPPPPLPTFMSSAPAAPPPLPTFMSSAPAPAAPAVFPGSLSISPHASASHDEPERDWTTMMQSTERPSTWKRNAAIAAVAVAVVAAGGFAASRFLAGPSNVPTGTLSVASNPPGAVVLVDNESRGSTPLTISLRPGPHVLVLTGSGDPRTIPITISAGAETSQYIELPVTAPPPSAVGQLQVKTEPAGAQVSIDGLPRGKSPVLVDGLTPGEHAVVLESDLGTVKQTVTIEAASTASLVVPMSVSGAPVSGWVSLKAPVELQIFENDRLLGTSESDRLMVSAGRHQLQIVNDTLGYRATAAVQVAPGKVAPIRIDWPKGTASLNAAPWAEVWIDGEKIGETPIGNLSLPIGPHEIVFRHPELGEQRYPVSVTLKGTARLSVDLRKKP